MKTKIVIHLNGGVVQNIFHDEPLPVGLEFFVVDENPHISNVDRVATSADGEERYIEQFFPELSEVSVYELLPAEDEPGDEEVA